MLSTLQDWLKLVFNFLLIYLFSGSVFSPSRSAHYLNVTLSNLVKVHVLFGVYNEPNYYRYLQNERNFVGYGDYGLATSISFSSLFDIL